MLIYEKIVRSTCRNIGFVSADVGLDADNCKVLVGIEQQSPNIAQGVHGHFTKKLEEIGAGDQGHMLGYTTDETPEFSQKEFTAKKPQSLVNLCIGVLGIPLEDIIEDLEEIAIGLPGDIKLAVAAIVRRRKLLSDDVLTKKVAE
ncbi:hypothetical protein KIW84_072182 [Lathyrus oleraceus]|uniref:Uncharacterized protein n=1 Tax=Pisum sativum TaxID=3888 RepID=A0A9D4VKL0_PEA|nr:hypothetical protein KIW84_072182 [Pisum sativum]